MTEAQVCKEHGQTARGLQKLTANLGTSPQTTLGE